MPSHLLIAFAHLHQLDGLINRIVLDAQLARHYRKAAANIDTARFGFAIPEGINRVPDARDRSRDDGPGELGKFFRGGNDFGTAFAHDDAAGSKCGDCAFRGFKRRRDERGVDCAGGQALSGLTWTRSGDVCTLDATDPTWTSATFTARYAVLYDDTPTSPADPLVMLYDFGTNKSCSNGAFTINVSASGFLSLTKAVP